MVYKLSNISKNTLLYIRDIRGTSIFNRRLSEVPEREKEKISCYAYMRVPEKNENTSHRGLTYTEILKGGPGEIFAKLSSVQTMQIFSLLLSLSFSRL